MNTTNNQEFAKLCSEHPECKGCPLKDKDIQMKGGLTRCITGRGKGNNNG